MPFEPFGYRFEINSPHSPAEVKAQIRSRKKTWFDLANGARGWIAGPFICLWFSAFDRYGPMLFGVVARESTGTRIRGRAGSDLNGILMLSLLIPFMLFLTYKLVSQGSASLQQLIIIAIVVIIGGPLTYWMAHKDRREAEPLVRFLRETVTISGQARRRRSSVAQISQSLTLSIGGDKCTERVSSELLHDALIGVGTASFVILEADPETYIQTASRGSDYIIEKRNGDERQHFRAIRRNSDTALSKHSTDLFDFEEVRAVFIAYASAAPDPPFLIWERMLLTK